MPLQADAEVSDRAIADRAAIESFLFLEARLADEHRYDDWEALWDQEALYWVPIGDSDDPTRHVSVIYDNRARLASRIRQLKTGRRHSQAPPSHIRRIISNIEIAGSADQPQVTSNFILMESRRSQLVTWAGQMIHQLRLKGGAYRIRSKTVRLVNSAEPISNLAFLI